MTERVIACFTRRRSAVRDRHRPSPWFDESDPAPRLRPARCARARGDRQAGRRGRRRAGARSRGVREPGGLAQRHGHAVPRPRAGRAAQAEGREHSASTSRGRSRRSARTSRSSSRATRYSAGEAGPSPSTCASARTRVVPKPANLTFEQAAAVPVAALTALQGLRDKGQDPARAEGPDQRRVGRRGHVRRADREVVRRGGDRRVQHGERRPRPVARRRPRHRLHAGGLHPERAALRPDARHRREPVVVGAAGAC